MRWNSSFRVLVPFKPVLHRVNQKDNVVDRSPPAMVIPMDNPNDQLRGLVQPHVPMLPFASDLDANSWQFVITHIQANDIAVDLGRIPVGFYITVEAEGAEQRTRNKPILVHDHSMEWDDEISLPLELSSNVCLRVCASFEFSPMLGNGETLRTFVVGIGELLEYSEIVKSIEFSPPEGEPISPCSLLRITVERRGRTLDAPTPLSNQQYHTSNLEESSSLAQITDEGHKNILRYHKDQKPEDLKRSITCFERAVQACPLTHQCRAVVLFNLATARLISCQVGITSPDFDVPITLYRDALDLRPVGHPDRPATLLHLARATTSRFLKWGDESYAEEARKLIAQVQGVCSVESYEYQLADAILQECTPSCEVTHGRIIVSQPANSPTSIAELEDTLLHTPDYHPRKPALLNALAFALLGRFERLRHMADIDGSIMAIEKAVELTQESHPEWPQRALSLGVLIGRRFDQSNNIEDLERSISVFDKVVQRTLAGHPDRPIGLNNLGVVLLARFDRLKQIADMNKSISAQEEALELVPNDHPNRSTFLTHLGVAFLKHFDHFHNPAYLDKSISLMEEAARCIPKDHVGPLSPTSRLEQLGGAADLHRAAFSRNEVLKILLDSRVIGHWRLTNLGYAFQARFDHFGDPADLDKSISIREEALKLVPGGHHDRPSSLASLGYTFLTRYQRVGNLADLHNSTSLLTEAVRLTPNDHPHRPSRLIEFGLSLLKRFDRFGKIVDIDKSISMGEEAVQHTPDHHPRKPLWLHTLGSSFLKRFERLGNLADLDKATSMMEEAVRLTPENDPDRPRRLTHLAMSFGACFDRLGHLSDLNKSVLMLEEAAQLVLDGHPAKPRVLGSLARVLLERSKHLGNAADLDKSISVGEKAAQLTSYEDPESPAMLNTLGGSLLTRFLQLGDVTDLDKSTSFREKALRLIPEGHPNRPAMLSSIGTSFWWRFQYLGSLPALRSAVSYFSSAARSRAPGQSSVKFKAFKYWIQSAVSLHHGSCSELHQALLEAYECAISLFPQLAWIGLPFKDRYTELLEATDITRSAVSVAVALGRTAKAVEWLEQGRCVVWGQLFQLRTPLDELRHAYPDLAHQIERLSNALEHTGAGGDESLSRFGEEQGQEESLEQRARRHRELVTERENLLEQVQALPGFEQFFQPKTYSQLRASAHLGPIVLLNVNPEYGSALIVAADLDEPVHVPLPDINDRQVEQLRTLLNKLLSNDGRVISRDHTHRAARPVAQDGRGFSYILSELWTKVVMPVLHALALFTPGKLTRVFWCPTGPFSFLPIHAAGHYDVPGFGNKASDFIISSYTPTLSVLAPSHEQTVVPNNIRLLAVPQPSSDGQTHLSDARTEIEHIRAIIGRHTSTHIHLRGSDGNVEGVLDGMEQSDWVHFACHGVQDPESPTDSGLCLADQRRLRLSDIIRLSRPRGGLAFLSACQTATGAVELSDEAVHLSAGMLFAGYSSVIGTMWSIRDSVAPRLAKDVYEQLFRDGRAPDSREAARALHNAVERLRQSGEPFMAWVPFIHMGI